MSLSFRWPIRANAEAPAPTFRPFPQVTRHFALAFYLHLIRSLNTIVWMHFGRLSIGARISINADLERPIDSHGYLIKRPTQSE
jgi:hypothetical protein